MNNDIEEIKVDVKEIKKILNGNGKPGIVARVCSLEGKSRLAGDWFTWAFRGVLVWLIMNK